MTVGVETPSITYNCTGGTEYSFNFTLLREEDLRVTRIESDSTETILTLGIDYSVVFNSGTSGMGKITTASTYTDGQLRLERNIEPTQETDFENYGPLDMENIERALDKLTMLFQDFQHQEVSQSGIIDIFGNSPVTIDKSDPQRPIVGVNIDVDKIGGDMEADGTSNQITIRSGGIEINEKWYYWDDLNFVAGPSGSNSGSDALPFSNAFVYIYVDASASDSETALTASNFISKSTAPSWNASKHGWYDGDDRCVGAMLYDASATAFFYQQKKGNKHAFVTKYTEVASASDISQIVTLSAVPGAGIAVGWEYLFGLESGSAGSKYILFYPTDGTSNLGSHTRFHQGTNLLKFWGEGIFSFAYPHNKVNIATGASTTLSNIYTTGFIYHDAM